MQVQYQRIHMVVVLDLDHTVIFEAGNIEPE